MHVSRNIRITAIENDERERNLRLYVLALLELARQVEDDEEGSALAGPAEADREQA